MEYKVQSVDFFQLPAASPMDKATLPSRRLCAHIPSETHGMPQSTALTTQNGITTSSCDTFVKTSFCSFPIDTATLPLTTVVGRRLRTVADTNHQSGVKRTCLKSTDRQCKTRTLRYAEGKKSKRPRKEGGKMLKA